MRSADNLIGIRFGRLVVVERADDYVTTKGKRYTQWLCKCDCGNEKIVRTTSLKSGDSKSCGCLMKESILKSNKKYNTYDLSGEYGIGYTSKGEEFYFDIEDYDRIKDYCWYLHRGYVISVEAQTNKEIYFHRLILPYMSNRVIDHINHQTNDNRKNNLRIVTQSENQMNKKKQSNNTSGVTGVYYDNKYNRWYSVINYNKNVLHLGHYNKFDDAVKARKEAEEKYFGEYSYDNSMNKH